VFSKAGALTGCLFACPPAFST